MDDGGVEVMEGGRDAHRNTVTLLLSGAISAIPIVDHCTATRRWSYTTNPPSEARSIRLSVLLSPEPVPCTATIRAPVTGL